MARKIKKDDVVVVISGKDSGKEGKVLAVFPDKNQVLVENINMIKRHKKATQNTKGGIVEMAAPLNSSKVMLVDPFNNKPTKVKFTKIDGKKKRKLVSSSEIV